MSLLAQIAIFLAAAVIAIPIFRYFKLGSVLGYLTAGIIIGPAGLGVISRIGTTLHVAEMCGGGADPCAKPMLPRFQVPAGMNEDGYARELEDLLRFVTQQSPRPRRDRRMVRGPRCLDPHARRRTRSRR